MSIKTNILVVIAPIVGTIIVCSVIERLLSVYPGVLSSFAGFAGLAFPY